MLADDPVELVAQAEVVFHFHLALALVHQLVIALGAGFAPYRPGNGIHDGGLAGTIFPRDAGGMNAGKRQLRRIAPVGHEVAHLEADGNHGGFILARAAFLLEGGASAQINEKDSRSSLACVARSIQGWV